MRNGAATIKVHPGDHLCSVYESDEQLISTVAAFLAEGLGRRERCWYVPSGDETGAIRAELECRGLTWLRSHVGRRSSCSTRMTRMSAAGSIPEQTMRVFSEAIEEALSDGFNGFRAAADMSWALRIVDGGELPGLDGYEIARTLPGASAAIFVARAVSGYAESPDRDKALAAGFSHHIAKPADPLQLADLIVNGDTLE